jgi:hypothetical protein
MDFTVVKIDSVFICLALTLMETWKNYKVPTAPELFWMIPHDEDLPQEVKIWILILIKLFLFKVVTFTRWDFN